VNGLGLDSRHEFRSKEVPRNHADFIWSVADLLRGDYKRSEYGKVVLPLTVLRRLDGVLAPTKQRVLEKHKQLQGRLETMDPVLNRITGVQFNNTSELDLRRVLDDPPNVADQLRQYVAGYAGNVRDIFEKFDLDAQIARLDASNLLYLVLGKVVDIDLGPESVSNFGSIGAASLVTRRFRSEETAVRSNKVTLIWGILTLISLLVVLVLMLMGVVSL
jgi:type I restriction enzyme M protein